ncbi:hypothetical protein CDL15_Pgr012703 [Punica granatum]|nr:hypothetical protein CDL15_Pgr012703 [Punica granatum]
MAPNSLYPVGQEDEKPRRGTNISQSWSKNGECPHGTISVLRMTEPAHRQPPPRFPQIIKNENAYGSNEVIFESPKGHEYAQLAAINGNYQGAAAYVNVWEPIVFSNETSTAHIWLASPGNRNNVIMAGWMVNPQSQFGKKPTFFIYWTVDGNQKTGCYNLDCPGFVKLNPDILGFPAPQISTYNGQQFDFNLRIVKDPSTNDWWVFLDTQAVGYWPGSLVTGLNKGAFIATWGGHVDFSSSPPVSRHTTTEMGSGHFPGEGFTKAAYFRNVGYATGDQNNKVGQVGEYYKLITRPECYDVQEGSNPDWGTSFYYGGPGYSANCQYST